MAKIDYQQLVLKQKKAVKTYGALCAFFLIIVGIYNYYKWADYQLYREAVQVNEETISYLKQETAVERVEYLNQKSEFDQLNYEVEDSLKEVFPAGDNYTELTRSFDAFEQETHRAKNPFVISNIEYQEIKESEDGTYKYLPLRMTISSSNDNFTKFMHYVEKSGSLIDKVRLMDIQSIHLSFSENSDSSSNTINFSINIHAYFQNI